MGWQLIKIPLECLWGTSIVVLAGPEILSSTMNTILFSKCISQCDLKPSGAEPAVSFLGMAVFIPAEVARTLSRELIWLL